MLHDMTHPSTDTCVCTGASSEKHTLKKIQIHLAKIIKKITLLKIASECALNKMTKRQGKIIKKEKGINYKTV